MYLDLRSFDRQDMKLFIENLGEPGYRARQLFQWIHKHGVRHADEMTNLPLAVRQKIQGKTRICQPEVLSKQVSKLDSTIKFLIKFDDGQTVETVIMPYEEKGRCTVCVSSQVGCPIGCPFCASGAAGFIRNLTVGEIISQVLLANSIGRVSKWNLTNVVFMGMGEPLLNYDAVLKSVKMLNDPWGLNIGQRRIVISTAGYVPGIIKLAEEKLQIVLAISLHSVENEVRDTLVPLNIKYPLEQLAEACRYYTEKTGRRITFEYAMINGINDTKKCSRKLADFVSPLLANVNIIPLNPNGSRKYYRSSSSRIREFVNELRNEGIEVAVREERGLDIDGACGQLRCRYF